MMSRADTTHIPVLLQEVMQHLAIAPSDIVFDGTVGGGGMSEAIALLLGEKGALIGVDLDNTALKRLEDRLQHRTYSLYLVKANFRDLARILDTLEIPRVTKVLFDLGLSSDELEHSGRGFTFKNESEPLLMTFDDAPKEGDLTAALILNTWSEASIADVLFGFGGERRAKKIARAIVEAREGKPFATVGDLVAVIKQVSPGYWRINPATRTFQALRMAVNDETGSLQEGIAAALNRLEKGGRLAIISFESITDRIVKRAFIQAAEKGIGAPLLKKPLTPSKAEMALNPRSRSAKLRIFEKQ